MINRSNVEDTEDVLYAFWKALNTSRKRGDRILPYKASVKTVPIPILSDKERLIRKNHIQSLLKFIRLLMDNNPELTNEDIISECLEMIIDIGKIIEEQENVWGITKRYYVLKYFKENQTEFRNLCKKLLDSGAISEELSESEHYGKLTMDFEDTKKRIARGVCAAFRIKKKKVQFTEDDEKFLKLFANSNTKTRNAFLKTVSSEYKESIEKNVKYFRPNEVDGIMEFFEENFKKEEHTIKQNYAKSIKSIIEVLDKLGAIDSAVLQYNKQYDRIGIPELKITKEEFLESYRQYLSDENVEKQDILKLMSMFSFWSNRLAKIINNHSFGWLYLNSSDSWDLVRTAKVLSKGTNKSTDDFQEKYDLSSEDCYLDIELDDYAIDILVDRYRFLQSRECHIYEQILPKLKNGSIKTYKDIMTEFINLEDDNIIKGYNTFFSKFAKVFPIIDYYEEFFDFIVYRIPERNLYSQKSYAIIMQLFSMFNQYPPLKNWGILLDSRESLEKKRMIIIALDIPGLNMPVRLHIDKNKILEFLKVNGKDDMIFPIYQGDLDFLYDNGDRIISTPLLIPVNEIFLEKIKNALEKHPEGDTWHNYLKHSEFIAKNGEIPDHMKDVEVEIRKKTDSRKGKRYKGVKKEEIKRSTFHKRFYDFSTNQVLVKKGSVFDVNPN